MTKTRAWPVRAMYLLIAAALVMSFMITAAPSQTVTAASGDVKAEWDRVDTPNMDSFVLAPGSSIIDYAVADGGEVAYAIVHGDFSWDGYLSDTWLFKSEEHAATWYSLNEELEEDEIRDALNITAGPFPDYDLLKVAIDPDDPDFVAVALNITGIIAVPGVYVFISKDGGSTFRSIGDVDLSKVFDLAISPKVDNKRNIAICGEGGSSPLYRNETLDDFGTGWKDGRDDDWEASQYVVDIEFSPDFAADYTILAVTVAGDTVYLQSGTWASIKWNEAAGFKPAVEITTNVEDGFLGNQYTGRLAAGIALPKDYSGRNADKRYGWVWVNMDDEHGRIFRFIDDLVNEIGEQAPNSPWLASVGYEGTIASGKVLVGLLGSADPSACLFAECCEGVQVMFNDTVAQMDICCPTWQLACKKPTGRGPMAVFYVRPDKAYAVTLGHPEDEAYDESAWSVSLDDGDTWNQISLIDTIISFLSDVAVSPNCNKTMLASVNLGPNGEWLWQGYPYDEPDLTWLGCYCDSVWYRAWSLAYAPEYSGKWLRTWCGRLQGSSEGSASMLAQEMSYQSLPDMSQYMSQSAQSLHFKYGILRLNPKEEDGTTVYLVDLGTDTLYYNDMQTMACWDPRAADIETIIDVAVKDESTIYALDLNGEVTMSPDYGVSPSWTDPVDSEVGNGWTIAVWGDDILVGGQDGDWNHAVYADGDLTFRGFANDPDAKLDIEGLVTMAFDSYFDQNDMIYAAVGGFGEEAGGIYRWVLDESEKWYDLEANPTCFQLTGDQDDCDCADPNERTVFYTGLVLDNADGNPKTDASTGGVLYASYIYFGGCECEDAYWTGVARLLKPAADVCCDEADWDYLIQAKYQNFEHALFIMMPRALKICGCLAPDTYTNLFAIGLDFVSLIDQIEGPPRDWYTAYDMDDGKYGTVWTFEDCYSKSGPDLRYPADGSLMDAEACDLCRNLPFSIGWDRMCDACNYQIQFALDPGFEQLVEPWLRDLDDGYGYYGPNPWSCICRSGAWEVRPVPAATPSAYVESWFVPGVTYYWRARAVMAETDQVIRSWWSDGQSFTIGLSAGMGIVLVTPEAGATGVPIEDIGFMWESKAKADSYNWVLSANPDLSDPEESRTGLTDTSWASNASLHYDTSYYWQVTSVKDGVDTDMARASFRTVEQKQYCHPTSGECFDTEADLRAHDQDLRDKQMITPAWVWVIIALGAVLVIVVIVLIFRTRRV